MISSKQCFKCGQILPLTGFYKHAQMGDGHLNKCINCTKADVKRHRLENLERVRSYDKYRAAAPHRVAAGKEYRATPQGKAAVRRAHKKWSVNNPERQAAVNAISNALRDGKIVRLHCFICGKGKSEAHHADYSNPLGVTWLCNEHHRQVHREHKEMETT